MAFSNGDSMSYCRWSSDDFKSDVYAFAHSDGGYETMISDCRQGNEPTPGPHAGKSFNDPTLETFRERLLWLREQGYCVPQKAIDRIDRELT